MKIAYLIGQYPATNHGYLSGEIRCLRDLGFDVRTVSISLPDRSLAELPPEQRRDAEDTRYIKSSPIGTIARAHFSTLRRAPKSYLRGLALALAAGGLRPLRTLRQIFYFIEAVILGDWIHRERITLLYVNFSLDVARLVCAIFPVPGVLVIHGFGELQEGPPGRLARTVRAMSAARCISRYNLDAASAICDPADRAKLVHVPLGIDAAHWPAQALRQTPAPFTLTNTGRLSPEKDQALLLEAIARLRKNGRNVRVNLVGDGPDRSALDQLVERLGIRDGVVFAGRVDNRALPDYYRSTDAFVLTSRFEGIPIVLMEAMALGIPCIAPRITGIPELIVDGSSGLLFPPGDVDSLTAAIERLMNDSMLRRTLSANGRARVLEDYDLRKNTQCLADILRRLA